jgi:DNA-binding response OmpR family regulator
MRRIRAQADPAKLPIIALSAHASNADRTECLAAGANAFMTKPIDMSQLLALIAELLGLAWQPAVATGAGTLG